MDAGNALLLNKRKQASLKDTAATCPWLSFAEEDEDWGRDEYFSAGGVEITALTLGTGAANLSAFSSASLLCCATRLSCSNVIITSTALAVPGLSTRIEEAFQHRSANNLERDLSLTRDKQPHVSPVARWDLRPPGARCFRIPLARREGGPQPSRSDEQGRGPRTATCLFADALPGLRPVRTLSSRPDKTACDECRGESSKATQRE